MPDLCLYQSHLAAGGPGALAAGGLRPRAAAASADHPARSTRSSSRRCASAFSATKRASRRMSLIDESGERYVRMAHLACVGSHAINGVAELHSELLKRDVLKDFYELWPHKFSNKTNGVTPRRWMVLSNPRLSDLISEHIGTRLDQGPGAVAGDWNRWPKTRNFAPAGATSSSQQASIRRPRRCSRTGIGRSTPHSMFDVLVKRIHEYKRQHLQVLHIVSLYHAHQIESAARDCAAHLHFRRQGGARIPSRQAHDQTDHRGRRRRQSRPGRAGPLESGVPAELQRDQRPARVPGGGPVGTDLHRRQGGLRNRQHEVLR